VKAYLIRAGAAFVLADGSRATGGQLIELDDDVAQAHADKLEPVQEVPEPVQAPALEAAPAPAPAPKPARGR
jgi:hypothetical protein